MASLEQSTNIADHLRAHAVRRPDHPALVWAAGRERDGAICYRRKSYAALDQEVQSLALGLHQAGLRDGDRCVVMLRPGSDFFCTFFALLRIGVVPVVVDPGMGLSRMLHCYQQSQPRGFVGIPLAHAVRVCSPRTFASVRVPVTAGRRWFWGGTTLARCAEGGPEGVTLGATPAHKEAAIVFTTGSTGPAKGVVLTHGMLAAQCATLRRHLQIEEDEVDLATFPSFAIFDLALGITAVLPEMDAAKPARANPAAIVDAIERHAVTNMFASPALLDRLCRSLSGPQQAFASLRRIISAGAPVAFRIVEQVLPLLAAETRLLIAYGATESVLVSSIDVRECLAELKGLSEQGLGLCVGRPLPGIEVRIVEISDAAVARWSETLQVKEGAVGEIAIRGALVSPGYFQRPEQDALHKIPHAGGAWHRTGDLGRLDSLGRLWLLGRKSQRVVTAEGTLFTLAAEPIFDAHPAVRRSALVGVGASPRQTPVLCVERAQQAAAEGQRALGRQLVELARRWPATERIETVLFPRRFPVDIRHNAKIGREWLASWAGQRVLPGRSA